MQSCIAGNVPGVSVERECTKPKIKKMSKEVSENQSQKNSQDEICEKSTITII